jgi:hypothetical protein
MKSFWLTFLCTAFTAFAAPAELPPPVTSLNGTDDIQLLIKSYPKEEYDITHTWCGLTPTPEFKEGYMMALRLCRLGAKPYYLVYSEYGKISKDNIPLKTLILTNYKHTAKLLEAIRGFNSSMSLTALLAKCDEKNRKAKH